MEILGGLRIALSSDFHIDILGGLKLELEMDLQLKAKLLMWMEIS